MKRGQVSARIRKKKFSCGTMRGVKVAPESVVLVIYSGYHVIIRHSVRPPHSRSLFSIRKIFLKPMVLSILSFSFRAAIKNAIFLPHRQILLQWSLVFQECRLVKGPHGQESFTVLWS